MRILGALSYEVREFAGHSDIRPTEIYFNRKEEDGEVAAKKIEIRLTGRKGPLNSYIWAPLRTASLIGLPPIFWAFLDKHGSGPAIRR